MTDPVTELPSPADRALDAKVSGRLHPASLGRNSAARFLADCSGLAFGMIAGVITARWLGPSGKGLFSSLSFLAALVMQVCSIGLGDAAIVLVGQRKATMQDAVSSTLFATMFSAAIGMVLLWTGAILAFGDDWDKVRSATLIACIGLPVSLLVYVLGFLLSAQDRVVASSVVLGLTSAVTTLGIVMFVRVLPLSLAGATLATVVGPAAGLVLAAVLVGRSGVSLRPRARWTYLRAALRYGVTVEASYLVTVMFLRLDLLVVYSLADADAAGQYSVALTVAALVGLLPIAISHGTFPRMAHVGDLDANELTVRAFRFGVIAAVAGGVTLWAAIPFAVPLLFGSDFRPAVAPAMLLVVGGIIWSSQWLLCRAAAARGRPGLLLRSFGLGLVVMVALDLALVPRFGLTGAAIGSVAGPAAGLVLCLRAYRNASWWSLPLRQLLPRSSDLRALATQSLALLPRPRRRVE